MAQVAVRVGSGGDPAARRVRFRAPRPSAAPTPAGPLNLTRPDIVRTVHEEYFA
ncbi:hypothetical protein I3W98_40670, partial [Streptomyces cavourensis]|nr:hypothetical protein [Streptomyces cavourensis]